jgi:hypothetical protein
MAMTRAVNIAASALEAKESHLLAASEAAATISLHRLFWRRRGLGLWHPSTSDIYYIGFRDVGVLLYNRSWGRDLDFLGCPRH